MYLWKCWRDTRGAFLIFLGAVLAVGAFGAYVRFDPGGWLASRPDASQELWRTLAGGMLASMVEIVPLAGFVLGALGVGTEFEKGTADFLLTRPRSRRYFLWTSWGLGAAEMAVLVLVSHPFQLTRLDPHHSFFRSLAAFWTLALVIYTVTYLMTTLARNSGHGAGLAVVTYVAYIGLWLWLRFWYDTNIPTPWQLALGSTRAGAAFPFTALAGWLAVCLALMLAAQFRFERAEV